MRAFDAGVVPLQRLLGRRREHHEQSGGVGAVAVDQRLRVDAVALGLRHRRHLVLDRAAVLLQLVALSDALVVEHGLDVLLPEVVLAGVGRLLEVRALEHHALRQQVLERLAELDQLQVAHHLGPEARVQQVQDRVLDAADVLVHRHPVVGAGTHHPIRIGRIAVAHEVPRRIDERVHRVRLAARGLAALGAADVQEAGVLVQRVAGAVRDQVFRQHHRQVLLGHRHHAAVVAVDDGNRRAPVALAAHAPVAQAPGRLLLAQAGGDDQFGHARNRILHAEAVERAGFDAHAALLVAVPLGPGIGGERLARHAHDLLDGQPVLFCEREVALVVRGHAHYRAVAVAHQHVVAHPHRHLGAGERVDDRQPRGQAFLFLGGQFGLGGAAGLGGRDECCERGVALGRVRGERVLGRDGAERDAHDGVGARGEHVELAVADQRAGVVMDRVREREAHALALADPVLLHQPHALGPAGEVLRVARVGDGRQQLLGVLRDVEVVARDLALFHRGARAPAVAVDDLLVGEHGHVHRIPVDDLRAALADAGLEHLQEQPLVPLVVGRVAGGDLARPVDGQAHRLHLLLHVGDVVVRPLRRRHLVLDGGVLGGQAEGVPAHGHQHVHALHAQLAREHVVDRVVAHMAHVQLAARVGQHRARVELLAAGVFDHAVGIGGAPVRLGGGFDLGGDVLFIHAPIVGGAGVRGATWRDPAAAPGSRRITNGYRAPVDAGALVTR